MTSPILAKILSQCQSYHVQFGVRPTLIHISNETWVDMVKSMNDIELYDTSPIEKGSCRIYGIEIVADPLVQSGSIVIDGPVS